MSRPAKRPQLRRKRTGQTGWGVFAVRKIKAGTTVSTFDGRFYDNDFEPWTEDLRNHTIQCGPTLWRDSKSLARFINHSCEPNCGIKGLFDVVAMRDIMAGEQLTWDYEMTEKSTWWRMRCKCGTPSCRKRIGDYRNMPRSVRLRYRGFISDWLTQKRTGA